MKIFGQVGISNNVTIGKGSVIMGKSVVAKNIGEFKKISGNFGRNHMEELKINAKIRNLK